MKALRPFCYVIASLLFSLILIIWSQYQQLSVAAKLDHRFSQSNSKLRCVFLSFLPSLPALNLEQQHECVRNVRASRFILPDANEKIPIWIAVFISSIPIYTDDWQINI